MPGLVGRLTPAGALAAVEVGLGASAVRAARQSQRPVPPPLPATALLDTGAEVTCVDAGLVRALALPFAGVAAANLPAHGGLTFGALHDAAMTILHPTGGRLAGLQVRDCTVLDVSLSALGYEVLLGRDILARCRFLYHGPLGKFRLTW